MLRIFIKTDEWREVDFNDDKVIALNDSMINITNPLKMATEYSKTISLPLTANNREVFQHYNQLNSLVTNAFDPTKAIPARVESNGNTVFDGYFNLTKVDLYGNKLEGNLYSYVNVWVNRMRQLTWDDFPEILPNDLTINKNTVYDSWVFNNNYNGPALFPDSDAYGYKWQDYIGFVPTIQGNPAQFESDKFITSDGNIVDVWEGLGLTGNALSNAKAILSKPSERQMLQFRSYHQKPYLWVNKLCRLVQWYCNNNEDMPDLEIDETWATKDNPNWFDLVYVLPDIIKDNDETEQAAMSSAFNLGTVSYTSNTTQQITYTQQQTATNFSGSMPVTSTDDINHEIIGDGWITGDGKTIDYTFNVNSTINFKVEFSYSTLGTYDDDFYQAYIRWNKKMRQIGQVMLYAGLVGENGQKIAGTEQLVKVWNPGITIQATKTTVNTGTNYTYKDTLSWSLSSENDTWTWNGTIAANTKVRPYLEWRVKNQFTNWEDWYDSYNTAYLVWTPDTSQSGFYDYQKQFMYYFMPKLKSYFRYGFDTTITTPHKIKYQAATRSGKKITMKDLWFAENDISIFNVFLKYLKLMNLVIVYDNFSSKLRVTTREKWMLEGYMNGIEDWSKKVDYGKDMFFTPLSWEDKYVELNYEDSDADKVKDFKDKYGFTYGTKRLTTQYSYNNETKQLLEDQDKINASAEMSEFMYTMYQIRQIASNPTSDANNRIDPVLPKEAYPINRSGDKSANIDNCFFYLKRRYNNSYVFWNTVFDTSINRSVNNASTSVCITDDSQYEINNGTYCFQDIVNISGWEQSGAGHKETASVNAIRIGAYPQLSHYTMVTTTSNGNSVNTPYCCLFSQPREDYFNPQAVNRNTNDVYNTRWSNLLPELYNEQNKLLTCYLYLTPEDYNNFKFNKFILINGVLYLMNKIVDYNPDTMNATKCELIQVLNPEAYTTSPEVQSIRWRELIHMNEILVGHIG